MKIARYKPRHHPKWKLTAERARVAEFYLQKGVVSVFSFPGGVVGRDDHRPFTTLELWLDPFLYHVHLPRHYHDRWLHRLARDFARQCWAMHNR